MKLQKSYRARYHGEGCDDDIVLIIESLENVNNRLDEWSLVLEEKVLRIIKNKRQYNIEYEFGRRDQKVERTTRPMTIGGDV